MGQISVSALASERRATERQPTTLRAKVFPGGADCVVADFSKRGAKLRFATPPELRGPVVVVLWSSGLAFEVELRWRAGAEVGVRFVGSRDLRRPAPPRLADIQALWLKRRPRIGRRQLAKQAAIVETRARGQRPAAWSTFRSSP